MKSLDQTIISLLTKAVASTPITINDIQHKFGDEIARMVKFMTDASQLEDGKRKKLKEIERQHNANAPADIQPVTLADLLDNAEPFVKYDPRLDSRFMTGMAWLLDVLKDEDASLYQECEALVEIFTVIETPNLGLVTISPHVVKFFRQLNNDSRVKPFEYAANVLKSPEIARLFMPLKVANRMLANGDDPDLLEFWVDQKRAITFLVNPKGSFRKVSMAIHKKYD